MKNEERFHISDPFTIIGEYKHGGVIDTKALGGELGVEVEDRDLGETDKGRIEENGSDGWRVVVNSRISSEDQLLASAWYLGVVILQRDKIGTGGLLGMDKRGKRIANLFALDILVGEEVRYDDESRTIEDYARQYGIMGSAIRYYQEHTRGLVGGKSKEEGKREYVRYDRPRGKRKYSLGWLISSNGLALRQIKAETDVRELGWFVGEGRQWTGKAVATKGEMGGYVSSEDNLSHEGLCWIGGNGRVSEEARVEDDGQVIGNGQASNKARIKEAGVISDDGRAMDTAILGGNSRLEQEAVACGTVELKGGKVLRGGTVLSEGIHDGRDDEWQGRE